jgi:Rod binding domain-containing protein
MIEGMLPTGTPQLPLNGGPGAGRTDASADRKAMHRQAVEFEAVYLAQMLKPMFEGIEAEAPFGGGFGEDVWRSMQVQQFGEAIAKSGGVGLADAVYGELLAAREARGQGAR